MPEFMLVKLDSERYGSGNSDEDLIEELDSLTHLLSDIGLYPDFAENVVEVVSAAGFEVEEGASEEYEKAKKAERLIRTRFDDMRQTVDNTAIEKDFFSGDIIDGAPDKAFLRIESIKARALIDIAEVLTLMTGFSR